MTNRVFNGFPLFRPWLPGSLHEKLLTCVPHLAAPKPSRATARSKLRMQQSMLFQKVYKCDIILRCHNALRAIVHWTTWERTNWHPPIHFIRAPVEPQNWPDLLPVAQSVNNNLSSPQRNNVCRNSVYVSSTISTNSNIRLIIYCKHCKQKVIHVEQLLDIKNCIENQEITRKYVQQKHLQKNRDRLQKTVLKGDLPTLSKVILFSSHDSTSTLVRSFVYDGTAREESQKDVNLLCLPSSGPSQSHIWNVQISRLKFFSDSDLDIKAIMPYVLSS